MDAANFQDDENWRGGYYELAIDLGPRSEPESTQRLREVLVAIWADDRLEGCYLDRWKSRDEQTRLGAVLTEEEHPGPMYGTATLPSGSRMVCVTHIVRETHDPDPHDWLSLCLPLGALARVDKRVGGFPFEQQDTSLVWRRPIDSWLVEVAQLAFASAQFEGALIDFEASGDGFSDDIEKHRCTYLLPHAGNLSVHLATS